MDTMTRILSQSGHTLIGVVVGGVMVIVGQLIAARASRRSAEQIADANRDIAEIGDHTARLELRLKQQEIILERQQSVAMRFLTKLEEWEDATSDVSQLGYEPSTVPTQFSNAYTGMQEWEGERIVREMQLLLPKSVSNAADSALRAGITAIARHDESFHASLDDNKEIQQNREEARIQALTNFHVARTRFLDAYQQSIVEIDEDGS